MSVCTTNLFFVVVYSCIWFIKFIFKFNKLLLFLEIIHSNWMTFGYVFSTRYPSNKVVQTYKLDSTYTCIVNHADTNNKIYEIPSWQTSFKESTSRNMKSLKLFTLFTVRWTPIPLVTRSWFLILTSIQYFVMTYLQIELNQVQLHHRLCSTVTFTIFIMSKVKFDLDLT